jgi:hypothetical protein
LSHVFTAGALYGARRDSRCLADFSSGVVWIQTQRQEKTHVALIPLDGFLRYFGPDPRDVADVIYAKARDVVARWKDYNNAAPPGERKNVGWVFELFTHEWKGARNKQEKSVFELHLNSWAATNAQQWEEFPQITLADLKVLLKVRTTVNLDERPDRAGKSADGMNLNNKGLVFATYRLCHCP